jgi:hypothetical protein
VSLEALRRGPKGSLINLNAEPIFRNDPKNAPPINLPAANKTPIARVTPFIAARNPNTLTKT